MDDRINTHVVGTFDRLEHMGFEGSRRCYTSGRREHIAEHHRPDPDRGTVQALDRRQVHNSEEAIEDHPCWAPSCASEDIEGRPE